MGAWGPAIFSDDLAQDVKDDFTDLIGQGLSPAVATTKLLADYGPAVTDDADEGPVFWLALAATQWRLGRLEDSVKERALQVVHSGINLKKWEQEAEPRDAKRRAQVLDNLKAQLLSPMPAAKKVKASYKEETEFEPGDVWCYQLSSGRWATLLVTELWVDKGGRSPIVALLGTASTPNWVHLVWSYVRFRLGPRSCRRLGIFRWSKTDYPQARLQRVRTGLRVPQPSYRDRMDFAIPWKHLDQLMLTEFGLQ